jgi:hypothetical protein
VRYPPRPCWCGRPARRGGKCARHHAQAERRRDIRRGTPAQRGYDQAHRDLRAELEPIVEAGEAVCWRCGEPIEVGEPWDLGHDDHDRSIHRGPEHASCNRGAPKRTPITTTGDN